MDLKNIQRTGCPSRPGLGSGSRTGETTASDSSSCDRSALEDICNDGWRQKASVSNYLAGASSA